MFDIRAYLRQALQRRADRRENDVDPDWDYTTTTLIKKRGDATTLGHFRPITMTINLRQVWELVLMGMVQKASEGLLGAAVFNGKDHLRHRTIDCICQGDGFAAARCKVGRDKAFGTSDLNRALAAATSDVWPVVARRVLWEH